MMMIKVRMLAMIMITIIIIKRRRKLMFPLLSCLLTDRNNSNVQ